MKVADLFAALSLKPDRGSFSKADKFIGGVKKALVGLVAIKTGQAFGRMISDVAQTADQFNKMSKQIGISSEALQQLEFAAKISGSDINVLRTGLQRFARTADDANQGMGSAKLTFDRLGVSVKDSTGKIRPIDALLASVADKFATMPDGTEKTALAMQTFGRAGAQLIPLLNEGSAGIGALREEFVALGGQISGETSKAFEDFNDDQQRIKTSLQGLKNQIVIALLPFLKETVKNTLEWVKANREWLKQRLVSAAKALVSVFKVLGRIFGRVIDTINSLVTWWENLRESLGENSIAFNTIKTVAVGAAVAIAAAWVAAAFPLLKFIAIATAVGLIGEDVFGLLTGKQSLLGAVIKKTNQSLLETAKIVGGPILEAGEQTLDFYRDTWVGDLAAIMRDAALNMIEKIRPFFTFVADATEEMTGNLRDALDFIPGIDSRDRNVVRSAIGVQQQASRPSGVGGNLTALTQNNDLNITVNAGAGVDPDGITRQIRRGVQQIFDTEAKKAGALMLIIDGFEVDANISETPSFDSEVTEHPVEDGADVSDHIRDRPTILTVEGVVTNTPIGQIADAREDSGALPATDGFTKLLAIRAAKEPVTIETDFRTYTNMALQSLVTPRDRTTGDALRFRATFKQIQLVTNERTTIAVSIPRAKKKRNRGNKPVAATPDAAQSPSAKTTDDAKSLANRTYLHRLAF